MESPLSSEALGVVQSDPAAPVLEVQSCMLMGIRQQEEITLGYFVKVISVHPVITVTYVQNREK
jgi:hypothetical protein